MPRDSNTDLSAAAGTPESPSERPIVQADAAPPVFQFGLRQLFWFMAVVSALLAGVVTTGGLSAAVFLLAAVVVIAHLFATALGSRLRTRADRQQGWDPADLPGSIRKKLSSDSPVKLAAIRAAAHSPWHGRGSTELPWLPRIIVFAVVLGGIVGATLIAWTTRSETSLAGIVVGAFSTAVLGGWLAFLGGSFCGVFRHGFREAVAEQKKDETARTFWQ